MEEAQCARSYRDEVEALRVRATRCDKLENDLVRYKQKVELMAETKLLLEEKVQSVEKKLMDYGET